MFPLATAFFISLAVSWGLIQLAKHASSLLDNQIDGVQKLHTRPVARVGGLAIVSAATVAWLSLRANFTELDTWLLSFLICSLPAFLGGIVEDLTKRVRPRWRMLCMLLSASVAFFYLDIRIPRVDMPIVDTLMAQWIWFTYLFTVVAILTMTNAINLIDGINGLAGMTCILIFASIAWVAHQLGDTLITTFCMIMIAAVLGFLCFNLPSGRIFLGDGGAYFLGFTLSVLSIMLVQRHPEISAWYPLAVLAYPLTEVIFSVYRRKILKGSATVQADSLHIHQLIFKCFSRGNQPQKHIKTAGYLWLLSLISIGPATFFYNRPIILIACFLLFCVSYVWLYFRIIALHTPTLLKQ